MPFAHPKIREDLVYSPDPNDESYYFVKCPIRNEFFHFNEIQVTLMEALDGTRDVEDLIEVVGEEWEIELTPTDIRLFEKTAGELLLLDVSSYVADDKKVRAEVRKRLKKSGFTIRIAQKDNPESQVFYQGMRHALSDSPLKATSYFHAVLEINPENQRARQVLTCIHEAFFHCHRSDLPLNSKSLRLFGPDKILGRIDRRIGRFIYSIPGGIAILLLCLLCVPLVLELLYSPEYAQATLGFADVVSFSLVFVLGFLVHELGHAMSCRHYGGHPNDLGLLLIYGIIPGAYCDTSDSYTFEHNRQKVITFLSGVLAQLVFTAMVLSALLLMSPDTPGWLGAVLAILFDITSVYGDLNPLMPLDGYYAVSDSLNITNLRGKSYSYVWSLVTRFVFGVRSHEFDEITSRERRIFTIYGVLSLVHLVFVVFVVVLHWLLPFLANRFGHAGIILCILILLGMAQRVVTKVVVPFLLFLFVERKTVFTLRRSVSYIIVGALLVLGLSHKGSVHVQGEFVAEPSRRVFVAAHEPGMVKDVVVREGELVEEGQLLVQLRSNDLVRRLAQARSAVVIAEVQLNMLRNGARSEEIALAMARTRSRRSVAAQMSARVRQAKTLLRSKVGSDAQLLEAQGAAVHARNRGRIAERQTDLIIAGTREEEIREAQAALEQKQAFLEGLELRNTNLELRSPFRGRVLSTRVHELIGKKVAAGNPLIEIADDSEWKLRIFPLPGESIEGVSVGQKIRARAWGFPGKEIELVIAKVLPPAPGADTRSAEYESTPIIAPEWTTGLSGHARIYGPQRSFAYRYLAEPVVQVFNLRIFDVVMQR